jgi:two-component system sensor kinase FixL
MPATIHWSDEARRILAIASAQPPTSTSDFVNNLVHPADRAGFTAAIQRAMDLRQACEIEHRVCRSDGEIRTLLTAIEPETTINGFKTVLCTALDITERSRMDAKLAELRSELWHVARLATAGEMAAVMAHEINQPLAAIAHTANACSRLNATGSIDKPELAEHLTEIYTQAQRASAIVQRIRNYVRKQPLAHQPIDLDRIIDDITRMLSPLSKALGIRIERNTDGNAHRVMGDEIQLGQLVLNLARNAFDAVAGNPIAGRGVTITTSLEDRDHIALEVIDNGPGIATEFRERIFEPFFTTRLNGLGMGLPIARTIAEAHQAVLVAGERADGERGARFRVVFAIAPLEADVAHDEHSLPD